MRLLNLTIHNIGPFDDARIEFLREPDERPAVTLITGENGTGKSILLDAIRGVFGSEYADLERRIWREAQAFAIELNVSAEQGLQALRSVEPFGHRNLWPKLSPYGATPGHVAGRERTSPWWVLDYWRSSLATDAYDIPALTMPPPESFLQGSLQGTYRNAAVTEFICSFDYLRGSSDPAERATGEALFATIERIVEASLLEGRFRHVQRSTRTPMVEQCGQLVPLGSVSSGNAYLINHLVGLLGKMYAVHVLRKTDPSTICETPGVLLLDEAENHLHPRWQKRLIHNILGVFPNLQIIATTHSPFVVSSVPGARVYVCRYPEASNGDGPRRCVVEEVTDAFDAQPVDDVLVSPAFDETTPFNDEITRLMAERKEAVRRGDEPQQKRIEAELQQKNPEYFAYFDVDEKLRSLGYERP